MKIDWDLRVKVYYSSIKIIIIIISFINICFTDGVDMNDIKLVSVIITTYGIPNKLFRAIESVLSQSYKNIELLVIDDNGKGSVYQKQTELIVRKYENKVKYIQHEKNLNGSAARNTGIRHSKGDYISFLDNDDILLPDRIKKSVEYLEKHTDSECVFTGVLIYTNGKFIDCVNNINPQKLLEGILSGTASIGTGSNLFFTKNAVDKVGFFDEKFTRFQDLEYIVRVLNEFKACSINDILIIKEGGGNNIPSYDKMKKNIDLFLNKFNYIIDDLDTKKQIKEYYQTELFKYSLTYNGTVEDIKKEKSNLEKYRPLKKEELLKYRYLFVYRFFIESKKKIKNIFLLQKILCIIDNLKNQNNEYNQYKSYL